MSLDTKENGAASSAIVLEQRVMDLPRVALNEHGTGTEVAFDMLSNELLLDGSARLNLATFVTTWMPAKAAAPDGPHGRQEHDRQGRVSADGRDRAALREHHRADVARARSRRRHRDLDHRLERGRDARWARAQMALARADEGRRQADRPSEPGHRRQRPGVLGEVLPLLGRRAAARADGGRALSPRRRGSGGGVRREHDRGRGRARVDVRRQLRADRRHLRGARPRSPPVAVPMCRFTSTAPLEASSPRSSSPTSSGISAFRVSSRSTPRATSTGSCTPVSVGRSGATTTRCRRISCST